MIDLMELLIEEHDVNLARKCEVTAVSVSWKRWDRTHWHTYINTCSLVIVVEGKEEDEHEETLYYSRGGVSSHKSVFTHHRIICSMQRNLYHSPRLSSCCTVSQ